MLVVNLFGGPGVGKSTLAAQVYSRLSQLKYNVEYVPEYAKGCIWSGCESLLQDQLLISANQHHMIDRLDGKVDIVVTDSPVIMGLAYRKLAGDTKYSTTFDRLLWELHRKHTHLDFIVPRVHDFVGNGRVHDKEMSIKADQAIEELLASNYHIKLLPNEDHVATIIRYATNKI